jgi:hypothetical protein
MAIDHGMAATQDAHACAPSACNISLPNVLTTRRYPQRPCDHHAKEVASKARGCEVLMSVAPARGTGRQCRCTFCTICFAMMSASTTGKPCAAKSADTVLFPVAIPPVRPMTRMVICDQSGTVRQFLRNSPDSGSTQEQVCCARGGILSGIATLGTELISVTGAQHRVGWHKTGQRSLPPSPLASWRVIALAATALVAEELNSPNAC